MSLLQNYALVIFDCDGVLVDSELIANKILANALTKEGYHCTFQESIIKFVGRDLQAIQQQVQHELGRRLSESFTTDLRLETVRAFTENLKPVKGIESALKRIPSCKCVASSGSLEKIHLCLSLTGLSNYFKKSSIFSAQDVPNGKPAPDLFLHAASRMNANPQDCVVVEDSVPGVIAAKAAGMPVFGYSGGEHTLSQHPADLAKAGALVFEDMAALPNHLQNTTPQKQQGSCL